MNTIHALLDDIEQIKNHKQHSSTDEHKQRLVVLEENMNKFENNRHFSRYEQQYQVNEMRKRMLQTITYVNSMDQEVEDHVEVEEDRIQEVPLMQGLGTHYITAWVGTPPQRKSAIVDTGSHYTAFPCKDCNNCGESYHTDKYFNPDKSSTFRKLGCDECYTVRCDKKKQCYFNQGYSEGSSWRAYQAKDSFFIGGNNRKTGGKNKVDKSYAVEFLFGCQTSETGLFITQLADGIMGLSADPATFPYYLYDQGKIKHKTLSLCFDAGEDSTKDGVFAGLMTMGGRTTSSALYSDMVYAKNIKPIGWATVRVRNLYMRKGGGNSARYYPNAEYKKLTIDTNAMNGSKGIIVDSGTTDTYFNRAIANEFKRVWKELVGRNFDNNFFSMTDEEADMLPTILLQIEGDDQDMSLLPANHDRYNIVGSALDPDHPNDVLIAISPYHYIEYANGKDQYVVRIYLSEGNGGVLGANAMFHHSVYFDWENHRIGFAESSCNVNESFELIHPTGVVVDGVDDGQEGIEDGTESVTESSSEEGTEVATETSAEGETEVATETNSEEEIESSTETSAEGEIESDIETATSELIPSQEDQDIASETEEVETPSSEEIDVDTPSSEETEVVVEEEQDIIPTAPETIRLPVPIPTEVEEKEKEVIEQSTETTLEQDTTEQEKGENDETPSIPEITTNTEETTNQEGGNDENDTTDSSASSITTTTASSEKMTTSEVIGTNDDENVDENSSTFIASMIGVGTFVFLAGFFTIRRWENRDIASFTDGIKNKERGKYSTLAQNAGDGYEGLDFHNEDINAFHDDNEEDLEQIELT